MGPTIALHNHSFYLPIVMTSLLNVVALCLLINFAFGDRVEDREYPEGLYTGEVNDKGQRHGQRRLVWHNGHVHEGEFREDRPNGLGVYTDERGNVFKGEYENGKRSLNGDVEFQFANGASFKGRAI